MIKIDCEYWTDIRSSCCGKCEKGLFGGRPSFGVCVAHCEHCKTAPTEVVHHQEKVRILADRPRVDKDQLSRRWDTCRACEKYKECRRCQTCGGTVYKKPIYCDDKCPEDRWPPEPSDGEMVSVIIPYYEEPYLDKTIKDITDNAHGDIEILAINDVNQEGMRVISNRAVKDAKGKYLLFIDAHCKLTFGWDTEMKRLCDENTVVYPAIRDMTMEKWEYCSGNYGPVYLNRFYEETWGSPNHPDEMVEESMGFTGCGWMIQRDTFYWHGMYDTSIGTFWGIGPEWSLKCWLSGGKVLYTRNVICGHGFRYAGNLPVREYHIGDGSAYNRLKYLTETMQLSHQIHNIWWLVDRFAPVYTWDLVPRPVIGDIHTVGHGFTQTTTMTANIGA